jgi:hypothetical protein
VTCVIFLGDKGIVFSVSGFCLVLAADFLLAFTAGALRTGFARSPVGSAFAVPLFEDFLTWLILFSLSLSGISWKVTFFLTAVTAVFVEVVMEAASALWEAARVRVCLVGFGTNSFFSVALSLVTLAVRPRFLLRASVWLSTKSSSRFLRGFRFVAVSGSTMSSSTGSVSHFGFAGFFGTMASFGCDWAFLLDRDFISALSVDLGSSGVTLIFRRVVVAAGAISSKGGTTSRFAGLDVSWVLADTCFARLEVPVLVPTLPVAAAKTSPATLFAAARERVTLLTGDGGIFRSKSFLLDVINWLIGKGCASGVSIEPEMFLFSGCDSSHSNLYQVLASKNRQPEPQQMSLDRTVFQHEYGVSSASCCIELEFAAALHHQAGILLTIEATRVLRLHSWRRSDPTWRCQI